MSEWTTPSWEWDIEERKHNKGRYWSVKGACKECGNKVFTAIPYSEKFAPSVKAVRERMEHSFRDHQEQHKPGRALDIEVEYELVARCSVCKDGGNIYVEDDVLLCDQCGTSWDMDGTMGKRNE